MIPKILRPLKSVFRQTLHLLFAPFAPCGARVLIYHSVDRIGSPISITPELFREHMDYLRDHGYVTWTASKFVAEVAAGRKPPRNVVVLTFDDGYINNITEALPILEERGQCATMFMVTQNDGDHPRWGKRDADRIHRMISQVFSGSAEEKRQIEASVQACLEERIATWDELRGAPERGFEIQSHTRTHPYMDKVDDARLDDELTGSRRDLEEQGFGVPSTIAWPYGVHDDRAIERARELGYQGSFLGGYYLRHRNHNDPMRINRVGVDPASGLFGLKFALGRGYDVLQVFKLLRGRRKEY